MASSQLPPLQRGDLPTITKLTKLRRLNDGKGYSYAHVKACLDENNPRTNDEIEALALELRQTRKASMDLLLAKRPTKRAARR